MSKSNIVLLLQYEENGDYARVRTEQIHARRVAYQLRTLLQEMETLRRQVRAEDWPLFDKHTQHSRDLTLKAIMDYLGKLLSICCSLFNILVKDTTVGKWLTILPSVSMSLHPAESLHHLDFASDVTICL